MLFSAPVLLNPFMVQGSGNYIINASSYLDNNQLM